MSLSVVSFRWDTYISSMLLLSSIRTLTFLISNERINMQKLIRSMTRIVTSANILCSRSPSSAKKIGATVKNFKVKEWDKVKKDIMHQLLTLSDPGYFRQLTIRGGGALKAPPPPMISKTILSIFTISYMCILPGVLGMF